MAKEALTAGTGTAAGVPRARPLLPHQARRPAGLVLGCAGLILASGAVFVRHQYGDPLDQRSDSWAISHLGQHSKALQLLADLGQEVQVIVIIAIMVAACLAARRRSGAVLAAVSTPAAAAATDKVLKPLADHLYSYATYPSGHATSVFAMIATAAVLLADPPEGRVRPSVRLWIVAGAVLIGCGVSIAVIGLGEHRVIDTVGGAAVGIAVVLMATFLLDLPASRRLLELARLGSRDPVPDAR
jgi:membrane-associated phospholipid phosphatase